MQHQEKKLKKTNDEKLDDLINGLLEEYPNKRMSWEQYFNHPFFNIEEIAIQEITIVYKNTEKK